MGPAEVRAMSAPDVDVTEEMRAAGAIILASYHRESAQAEDVAEEIFRAMLAVAPRSLGQPLAASE